MSTTGDVSQGETFLENPLFRWGMPATSAAIAVAIALLIVEDQVVQLAIFSVAAIDVLVAPQILKQAARDG